MNSLHEEEAVSLETYLSGAQTVAIIGCSSNPYRTSYHIAEYLVNAGFAMIPVNPNETSVLGQTCYPSIFEVPGDRQIDLIDIFRNKAYTEQMVEEIVAWSRRSGQKPVIWTQLDVSTDAAKVLAQKNGLPYVENRCLMVEHRRITGEQK